MQMYYKTIVKLILLCRHYERSEAIHAFFWIASSYRPRNDDAPNFS